MIKNKKHTSIIHPTAVIEQDVQIGNNVAIWHFVHIREGAKIDDNVSLARDVYIDKNVHVGEGTRIQNGVSVYSGLEIGKYCFIGPHVIFTNDLVPRSTNKRWSLLPTILKTGCSIGAGSILICGVTIGEFALVGAGSVVTQKVSPFHLVMGSPARVKKMICACGATSLPLGTSCKSLVAKCCLKNLKKEVISLAKSCARK